MLPLLDLTHQLALQSTFTITIIITPKNLPILTPLLSTHPNTIKTLILPFPSHPKIPSDVENLREIENPGNYPFINALSNLQNPIIQWFKTHHNIPRITFYSSGTFLTAVINRCWRNPLFFQSQEVVEFNEIHGTPSFKRDHLPSLFRRYVESDPESEFVKDSFVSNDERWGFVINTFRALEGAYLDHIQGQFGNIRIFVVGPLGYDWVGSDLEGGSNVLWWLDKWDEDGLVLYVCFGSQTLMTRDQMEALKFGLERSGIRFVWVVKVPSTVEQIEEGYGLVPEGFEDRVLDRGIVVKGWAPQIAILGHRVVGGFLSHCGWNLVLETVDAEVGILGWPMEADHFVNAKLLVENMGVDEWGRLGERVEFFMSELQKMSFEAHDKAQSTLKDWFKEVVKSMEEVEIKRTQEKIKLYISDTLVYLDASSIISSNIHSENLDLKWLTKLKVESNSSPILEKLKNDPELEQENKKLKRELVEQRLLFAEYKRKTDAQLEEARIREENLIRSNNEFKEDMKKQSETINRMLNEMMEMFQKQAKP